MEVLNPSPVLALPKTMWLAWEVAGKRTDLTEAELINLIRPESLRGTAPQQGAHAARAVACLKELRLLVSDSEGILNAEGQGGLQYFTERLRRAVTIDPASVGGEYQGAPDLRAGLSWLLEQSPMEPLHWEENVQDLTTPEVLKNDTRWNGFRTWATFLGFGRIATSLHTSGRGDRLLSNPFDAVHAALRAAVKSGERLGSPIPFGHLLTAMHDELPVFLRRDIGKAEGPNVVAPGIAYGFLGLEHRGILTLQRQSDSAGAIGLPDPFDSKVIRYVSSATIDGSLK